VREGAAIREHHQLREGVGALGAAEERGVSALRADECGSCRCRGDESGGGGGDGGGGGAAAAAAQGEVYRHFSMQEVFDV